MRQQLVLFLVEEKLMMENSLRFREGLPPLTNEEKRELILMEEYSLGLLDDRDLEMLAAELA